MSQDMQNLQAQFGNWAMTASHLIGELFDAAKPYLEGQQGELDNYLRFVGNQLFIDCHLSSESVLILVREGKEWDADLVNRAVMEGTVKYVYLMDGTPSEMKAKAQEYWEIIPDFLSIKRSERAKAILSEVDNLDDPQWYPLKELVISDEEIERRRHGLNKAQRSEIEQKWSFSYIIQQYARTNRPGLKYLAYMAYGYGMSSHLVHKDGDGVGMVLERYQRDPLRYEAVKCGHSARLVSDTCALAKLRLMRLLLACGADVVKLAELEERYQHLDESLRAASDAFSSIEYPET